MGRLLLENISRTFAGSGESGAITAVNQFSLELAEGELLVLLGPSGCGKTTLLRLIAGLDKPSSGRILLAGQSLDGIPPQNRRIGMAFQYPALLPQLTVAQNIALGPKLRGVAKGETATRVRELAEALRITDLLERAPETLSGGQQQRVSLARALANRPEVLLLDEPLANLDPPSRADLREAIRAVQQQLRVTTLYVTHDQAEAAAIADRIALMNGGTFQQAGTAAEIYRNPANLFVAEFFDPDRPNIFAATISDGRLHSRQGEFNFPVEISDSRAVTVLIRSRAISFGDRFRAPLRSVQHTGWSTRAVVDFAGLSLRAELPFTPRLKPGDILSFTLDARDLLLFDASGARIRS